MNKTLKGVLLTLASALCWGLSGVSGECLMRSGDITSKYLVSVRLLSSGIILMVHQSIKHKKQIFDIFRSKRDAFDLLVYSILGIMLCQFTYFYTIEHSNAGVATILQYTAPVIIMAVTCFCEKRLPRAIELICVTMAIAGVFIIATHGNINTLAMSKRALVVGLISAVTVVIYSLQPIRLMKKYSPLYMLSWAFVIGGIILAIVFKLWEYEPHLTLSGVGLVAVTSIVGSIFGYALYLCGVKNIGGTKACLIGSVEPISAAVFSAVFLETDFTLFDIIGFVLIVTTVVILSFDKQ